MTGDINNMDFAVLNKSIKNRLAPLTHTKQQQQHQWSHHFSFAEKRYQRPGHESFGKYPSNIPDKCNINSAFGILSLYHRCTDDEKKTVSSTKVNRSCHCKASDRKPPNSTNFQFGQINEIYTVSFSHVVVSLFVCPLLPDVV